MVLRKQNAPWLKSMVIAIKKAWFTWIENVSLLSVRKDNTNIYAPGKSLVILIIHNLFRFSIIYYAFKKNTETRWSWFKSRTKNVRLKRCVAGNVRRFFVL